MNNPNVVATGNICLLGDHYDQSGNYLGTARVVLRIVNGCICTITITQTVIQPGAGAVAFAGSAPTVTNNVIVTRTPTVGAVTITGQLATRSP